MAETARDIERHIVEERRELKKNISTLERKAKSAVDWRAQFEAHPELMTLLAFGGGMLVSRLLGGRKPERTVYVFARPRR